MLKKTPDLYSKPLVSVCMITYNHEKYIAEAIEGVLGQEVDFEVELVIADDASTDSTGEVIQTLIHSHSRGSWIKYIRHTLNKGMMCNFIFALEQCKGEYIALCEGDDYWIDSHKLLHQVNFLKRNPRFVFSFHDAFYLYNERISKKFSDKYKFLRRDNKIFSIKDLEEFKWFIPTCSIVFRNVEIPKWIRNSSVGDFTLQLILSEKGDFYFHESVFSVYRIHDLGVSKVVNNYKNRLNDIYLWYSNINSLNKIVLLRWYLSVLWRFFFTRIFR